MWARAISITRPIPWLFVRVSTSDPLQRLQLARLFLGINVPVNIKHAKCTNSVLPQQTLLACVNVPQTNVDELAERQLVLLLQPAKALFAVITSKPCQESNRHAVDVAATARLGSVDIGVGIDPDDGNVAVEALANGLGTAANRANGNGVVTTKGENETTEARMAVDLIGNAAGNGGNGTRVLHAAVRGIAALWGDEIGVEMDSVIAVQLVAELVAQLGEQARFDQGRGRSINTGFALEED